MILLDFVSISRLRRSKKHDKKYVKLHKVEIHKWKITTLINIQTTLININKYANIILPLFIIHCIRNITFLLFMQFYTYSYIVI